MADDQYVDVTDEYKKAPNDGYTDVTDEYAQTPEPDYYDTTIAALQKGFNNVENAAGGVARTVGRHIGSQDGSFFGSVGQDIQDVGKAAEEDAAPWIQGADQTLAKVPKGSAKSVYSDVLEGTAGAVPSMVASAGNYPLMLGYNAIQRFGGTQSNLERQLTDKAKAEGVTAPSDIADKSEAGAAVESLGNIPFDAISMAPWFNSSRGLAGKVAESGAVGAVTAFPQKFVDLFSNYVGGLTSKEPELKDITKDWETTATQGAVSNAGGAALLHAITHVGPDYHSAEAQKSKVNEWSEKLDQQEAQRMMDAANQQAGTVPVGAPAETVPSDAGQQLGQRFGPEETPQIARPSEPPPVHDPKPIDAGSDFDKTKATKYFNDKAATKLGATDPLVDGPKTEIQPPKVPKQSANEGDPTLQTPVQEINLSNITLSKDVPNFKRAATGQSDIVKSETIPKYKSDMPPIVVWQRSDGSHEVITGRHRFNAANNTPGKKTISAQVVREQDGFTKEDAARYDAEANIRDGTGETQDYAKYFKDTNLNPQEVQQRGLISNKKAQDGYVIATTAADNTYNLYQADKISTEHAAAISKAAPKNEDVQNLGVKATMKGATPDQIPNILNDMGAGQAEIVDPGDSKLDLSIQKSRVATSKRAAIDAQIKDLQAQGTKLSKNSKEAQAAIQNLINQRNQWSTWADSPDLKQSLTDAIQSPEITHDPDIGKEKFAVRKLVEEKDNLKNKIIELQKQVNDPTLSSFHRVGMMDDIANLRKQIAFLERPSTSVEQVNAKDYFHGTSGDFADFNLEKADPGALYGPGIYLTENPQIASSYANNTEKYGGSPSVRKIGVSLKNPFFADRPLSREEAKYLVHTDHPNKTYYSKEIDDLFSLKNQKVFGTDVLDLMNFGTLTRGSQSEVLTKLGYDGIVYTGGHKAGGGKLPHEVVIAFDPKSVYNKIGETQIDNSADTFLVEKPFTEPTQPTEIKGPKTVSKTIKSEPLTEMGTSSQSAPAKALSVAERLRDQKGAINLELPSIFTRDGLKTFVGKIKPGVKTEKLPEVYKFFASKRNLLASEITKAEKFPWYNKAHQAALQMFEKQNSISWDHDAALRPFTLLNAKEKQNVTGLMYAGQRKGAEFDSSPGSLRQLGLTDREIRGVQSVRKVLDNSLEMSRNLATEKVNRSTASEQDKQTKIDDLNQKFDQMKVSNYVPTGRYGKFGLTIYKTDGSQPDFIMSDSKSHLKRAFNDTVRSGAPVDFKTSKIARVPRAATTDFIGAHPDILTIMQDANSRIPTNSFENRFKQRKFIEGYDMDLQRNLASYLSSHARYVSAQGARMQFSDISKSFDASLRQMGKRDQDLHSYLRKSIDDLQRYVMTPSDNLINVSKAFSYYYLANNVKTSLVNSTSFLTSSYPQIAKYAKGIRPEAIFAKSLAQTAEYYGRKVFGKNNTDLFSGVEQARKEGIVGGNRVYKDLLAKANKPTGKLDQNLSFQDAAFMLNGATEDFVRVNAYITGWNTYPHAKEYFQRISNRNNRQSGYQAGEGDIQIPDQHTFAKDFVRSTQADYTKAGIPDIAKNQVGKLGSTFRLYHHAFFTNIKNSVMEAQLGVGTRYLAALGGLGGVFAVPLIGNALKVMKASGFDAEQSLDDGLVKYFGITDPKTQRAITRGAPTLANLDVKGAISSDIVPEEISKGDVPTALGKAFLGVLADPFDRMSRAYYYGKQKGDTSRAIEQVLPPGGNIQGVAKAIRYQEKGYRDSNNDPLLQPNRALTPFEIGATALGATPASLSSAYDIRLDKEKAVADAKDTGNVNHKIAMALFEGDKPSARALARSVKGDIDVDEIQSQMAAMKSGKYADYKNFGVKGYPIAKGIQQRLGGLTEP